MKLTALILICALLTFPGFCSPNAETITNFIEISSELKVVQTINFTMKNHDEKAESALLLMPYEPKRFEVLDSESRLLNYSSGTSGGIFFIKIKETMLPQASKSYFVKVYDDSLIASFGPSNIFTYNFISYYELKDLTIILSIPDSYAITSSQGSPINPLPSKLYSSSGAIILEWSQAMSYLDSKTLFVFFEKSKGSNFAFLIGAIILIVGFGLGALSVFIFFKKIRAKTLTKVLSKDEQKIIELLLKQKEMSQKEIGTILDMSKPKLSKLIKGLSEKEVIEVTPKGRNNIIIPKKEML